MSDSRGFATSGAYLVIGVAVLLALGTLHTAVSNRTERVSEATQEAQERRIALGQSALAVGEATWNSTATNLTVTATNTGETALSVADTAVLVDGTYVDLSAFESVTIDGRSRPAVWNPGERLVLVDEDTVEGIVTTPDRVKVVGEYGVADIEAVTTVS